ncbi:hypothetical protein ULM_08410 [Legionella pneumophila]|nr:hypothetical protein [Legionella pneumophila]AMV13527.1 hypothetical protein ULM_08410 [Legionella pneumophila]
MKSILFVINEAGEFVELSKIALAIQQQGYDVSFLFVSPSYVNLENDSKFCEKITFLFIIHLNLLISNQKVGMNLHLQKVIL